MLMSKKPIMQSRSFAFSLVEMSVVIGIVGLLLSIILISTHLKDSANVNVLLSEQYVYQTAMSNFYKMYNAIPGDMSNAVTTFACDKQNRECQNGNGNKLIERGTATINEQYQVWRHLYLAQLITFNGTGKISTAIAGHASEVGVNIPPSKLNIFDKLGYTIYYPSQQNTHNSTQTGCNTIADTQIKHHIFKLSDFDEQNQCGGGVIGAISSAIMYKVDEKIDDGLPQSGNVRAEETISSECYVTRPDYTRYTMKSNLTSCNLLILLTSLGS